MEISQKKAAKIAGFMFLFSFIIPTLNWTLVLSKFNVAENAVATANNIIANELLFRIGITIELFMSVGLIVLGWALYTMLSKVNKGLALLALLIKLAEAAIGAVIVLISFIALLVLNAEPYLGVFTPEQLKVPVAFILNAHTTIWAIPMVILGLDMMLFSYLFFKSRYIPRKIAGFGILSFVLVFIHAMMYLIAPIWASMMIMQTIFWAPSGIFELVIGVWLLWKGINIQSHNNSDVGSIS